MAKQKTQLAKFQEAMKLAKQFGCTVWPKLGKFQLWRNCPELKLILESRKIDDILDKLKG
jgi:hypothetical protein